MPRSFWRTLASRICCWTGSPVVTLTDHAVNGYTGESGYMPPKGGQVNLSDEEVISAIEYMLEQLEQ